MARWGLTSDHSTKASGRPSAAAMAQWGITQPNMSSIGAGSTHSAAGDTKGGKETMLRHDSTGSLGVVDEGSESDESLSFAEASKASLHASLTSLGNTKDTAESHDSAETLEAKKVAAPATETEPQQNEVVAEGVANADSATDAVETPRLSGQGTAEAEHSPDGPAVVSPS